MFDRRLTQLRWGVLLVMLLVPLRLITLCLWQREGLNRHPYNSRLQERLEFRGSVRDRQGRAIATSQGARRQYPYGALLAHWTGYHSNQLGVAGVERWKNELLRERRETDGVKSVPGRSLRLSLDLDWQRRLSSHFPDCAGAALLVELNQGQILAALSRPDFEPSRVGVDWKGWQTDPAAPLLNRPLLGLYPAGQLGAEWSRYYQDLPRRPATLMDWTAPQPSQGLWLMAPVHVAALIQHWGSSLPLSQLYSQYSQPWKGSPRAPLSQVRGGWQWAQVVITPTQRVCWAVIVAPPYCLVTVWEEWGEADTALQAGWKIVRP